MVPEGELNGHRLPLPGAMEGEKTVTRPIEITGKLVLENAAEKKAPQNVVPDSATT